MNSLKDVNTDIPDGRLLLMALSKLTCTVYTDKTPCEVVQILQAMADDSDMGNDDMLESAWGIIANAYGGDWDLAQNKDWKPAVIRWRDQYHSNLPEPLTKEESI